MEFWHHGKWCPCGSPGKMDRAGPLTLINKFYICRRSVFFCCYCKITHRGICFRNRKTQRLTALNTPAGADLSLNIPTGFCMLVWSLCFGSGWAPLPCPSYVSEYLCLVPLLLARLTGCSAGIGPRPDVGTLESIPVFRHLL